MFRTTRTTLFLLSLSCLACHHEPPPAVTPPVATVRENRDSIEAATRARLEAARRDSIARDEAARRAAAARAESAHAAWVTAARATVQSTIYFQFDDAALTPDATAALDAKIPILRDNPAIRIRIEGDTDDRGTSEYNLALGQRRAASAKRYLSSHGIDESRIEITSLGDAQPVCNVDDEPCWQRNRRDEFVITAGTP